MILEINLINGCVLMFPNMGSAHFYHPGVMDDHDLVLKHIETHHLRLFLDLRSSLRKNVGMPCLPSPSHHQFYSCYVYHSQMGDIYC